MLRFTPSASPRAADVIDSARSARRLLETSASQGRESHSIGVHRHHRSRATITAAGFVTRETRIEWKAGGRTDVALTLLPARAPFSLEFYRMLVRNGLEEPATLEPVRRWSVNPNFYINAHNPRTNAKLTASEVADIEETVRQVVPQLTGGLLTDRIGRRNAIEHILRDGDAVERGSGIVSIVDSDRGPV